jgi:hypothetical protein
MRSKTHQRQFLNDKPHDGLLGQDFFFHHYVSFVIQLAFVPKGAVGPVVFACSGVNGKLLGYPFVMGPSFISSGF